MYIYVKPLKGNATEIDVSSSHSVLDVKQVITLQLGIPVTEQKLVYQGKSLLDNKCLQDYNIREGAKLFLFRKKDSDATPAERRETITSTSQSCKVDAGLSDTTSLWHILKQFLTRHFTEKDAEKVLYQFKKSLESKLASLSLDDIERLANRKLGLMESSITDDIVRFKKKSGIPWWNDYCAAAKKAHQKAYTQVRRTLHPDDWLAYKRQCTVVKRVTRQAKRAYWRN
ncbi:hypothetical protein ScPMuIL_007993 [Solemya velum]